MDPLSDVLSLLKLHGYASGGFHAGGDWCIAVGGDDAIKMYAAVSGDCWIVADGVPEPVHVVPGDCLLLPPGRAFRVGSDITLPPVDVLALGSAAFKEGGITRYNGGGDFLCVGGIFTVAGDDATVLLEMLPPVVHIHDERDKALLRWSIDRMRAELRDPQPGGFLVAQQLATMMLVAVLRMYLAEGTNGGVGWLFALGDKQMAAAIGAMHDDPAGRWTLHALAERAGMSRTSFTLKFRGMVGTSPMEYLTRWRMALAADRLVHSADSVAEIALGLGYESESAFSTAFKRLKGCSPRQYGRGRRETSGIAS